MTFIILLQALFATSFPMGKYLMNFASPLFLSGTRMLLAGSILLIYEYFRSSTAFHLQKKHLWTFFQITVLGMYATYALRLYALRVLPVWKVSFFYNFSPFLTALFAYLLFNQKLSLKQWMGLSIGFIGMIPILISSTPAEASIGESFISWYEIFLIISVSLHCYSWILIQKLVRYKNYRTSIVTGICMASGGFISLVNAFILEGTPNVSDPAAFCKGLLIMIFVSNILCHNIYAGLLKNYSATFMSFTSFLSPIFAALYGWAFFQEKISWHFYVSIIIVLAGLYIFYQDELKIKSLFEEKKLEV
jgi:drug/metabolite transporter (DMT)-like permease